MILSDRRMYLIALSVVAILFFGSCIYGYAESAAKPQTGDALSASFQEMITELDSEAPTNLPWQLFFNNLKVCMILFIGGVTFGVVSLSVLLTNGYMIGGLSEVMLRGYDHAVFAASIIPHGIFEIWALLMSGALGLQMGYALLLDIQGKGNAGDVCLWYGTRFLCVVVPLLIVAALFETFVSPVAADLVVAALY